MRADFVVDRRALEQAPRLVAITDTTRADELLLLLKTEKLCRMARPGSIAVQLRDKQLGVRERYALGLELRRVTERYQQWLWVNERIDLCVLLGADGVHLGEGSVSVADARRLLGAHQIVSRACHSLDAVTQQDADVVLLSPICAERKGRPPLGMSALAAARARIDAASSGPLLYALGGISDAEVPACLAHGADGVAAIGAVWVASAVERLLGALSILRD